MLLRPYQQRAVDEVVRYWRAGRNDPLAVLPTAAGKSLILAATAEFVTSKRGATGRVLVLAHKKELVAQNAEKLRKACPGVTVGVYCAGLGSWDIGQITCASRDSIAGKVHLLGRIDLIIIDEAHMVSAKEQTRYAQIIAEIRKMRPGAQVLGLTATPYRLDQGYLTQGEGALFTAIAVDISVRELLSEGYITPIVTADVSAEINTSGVRTSMGDFAAADLELAADIDEVTGAVVEDLLTAFASGRRSAMVFCCGVEHCHHVAQALMARGVTVGVVTGETPTDERDKTIAAFVRGDLQTIVNMDVLTTGFDAPCVDVIALIRPTKSTTLYVQIVGRGCRLIDWQIGNLPTAEARIEAINASIKPDCLLLDYGGNIARHGPIDDVNIKEVGKKGEGKAPVKLCKVCRQEQPAGVRVCIGCGTEFPPIEKKANAKASSLPAIGRAVERHRDFKMRYGRQKIVKGTLEIQMLRVSYELPNGVTATEYVSRKRTRVDGSPNWWTLRVGGEMPRTVDDMIAHLNAHGQRPIDWIEVQVNKRGRMEVTHVELAG